MPVMDLEVEAVKDMPDLSAVSVVGASPAVVGDVWDEIRRQFWTWYAAHEQDTILKKKLPIFGSIRVRVKHLHDVFVQIFGKPQA